MATDSAAPKVFISHASEDKAFVLDFASRLRARGVDAWLDRWEILPGDSFVRKIFDEGLGQAKAVIVVISRASAEKPWVREELDVAVVRKINRTSKLIPVIIDDSKVPNCLQATLWERIADVRSYDESLDRIVLAIFGQTDKPPVGEAPAFARAPALAIGDLTQADSQVLQAACEMCLEEGYALTLYEEDLHERAGKLGLADEAIHDSIGILIGRGYLRPEVGFLVIEPAGFEEYLRARPDYEGLLKKFASGVVNEGMSDSKALGELLKVPYVLLNHVFERFNERKWILAARYGDGRWEIEPGRFSPEMKRWLAS